MSALNLYIHNRRLDFSKASVRKTETNCRQWAKNKGLVSPNKFGRRCSVAFYFLINDELAEWRTHFIIYQRYRRAMRENKSKNRDSISKRRMLTRSPTCCRRQVNSLEVQRRHDIRRRCTGKERTEMLGVVSSAVVDILVDRMHPAARQSLSLFQKRPIQSRGWTSPPTPILWGRERPATKAITDDGNSPAFCRAYDERNERRMKNRGESRSFHLRENEIFVQASATGSPLNKWPT